MKYPMILLAGYRDYKAAGLEPELDCVHVDQNQFVRGKLIGEIDPSTPYLGDCLQEPFQVLDRLEASLVSDLFVCTLFLIATRRNAAGKFTVSRLVFTKRNYDRAGVYNTIRHFYQEPRSSLFSVPVSHNVTFDDTGHLPY